MAVAVMAQGEPYTHEIEMPDGSIVVLEHSVTEDSDLVSHREWTTITPTAHTVPGAIVPMDEGMQIGCVAVIEWFDVLPEDASVYVTESGYTLTVPSSDPYGLRGPRSWFFATEKELSAFVMGYRLAKEHIKDLVTKWERKQ